MSIRELTAQKHKQAEQMPFNQKIMEGKITEKEYADYLRSQYDIFSTIEAKFGLPHSEMTRSENILDDLTTLGVEDLGSPGNKTREYCNYLSSLNSFEEVFPHIYLNYMAVMMGGQILKSKVPGSGRMYDFVDGETFREIVKKIRDTITDADADEVNRGYDYIISIFEELQNLNQHG